ncbi:ferredoxin-type protein NapG [Helicobacter monodelphidis]|uniref:ferredoxin-type protein NapG n=1 Tax=Helicobacter sp. 15-1451 TaxID=2004995 RepID=UPI000DCCEC6A|nr:ferredoxin-type protein NapG [Helicobacter sp. 15-1451]RAX58336.1 ferredoxin-type protein NapG [Helicobacter sp. 15-1451]
MNPKNPNRRQVFLNIVRGACAVAMGGVVWSAFSSSQAKTTTLLRPPGARMEKDFLRSCIRCGLCVNACPYGTLRLATIESDIPLGTPYFVAREVPCEMCEDIPCVPPCPTDALDENLLRYRGENQFNIALARMGVAVVDSYACIAYWGIQCDACYRACPLIDSAISLEYRSNDRTQKHAYLLPVVHNEACTGCGMCERACVTQKPSITIVEREKVLGIADTHYIKGWDKNDEKRLENVKQPNKNTTNRTIHQVEDYLNEEL